MVLDVDLNTPVVESFGEEGTSSYPPSSQEAQGGQQGAPLQPAAPIDVDLIDDDVFVSSARAFSEAKQNSRRNRGRTIIDVDLEESTTTRHAANHRNKRLRVPSNQRIINCESYVNLEGCANSMGDRFRPIEQEIMPPPPPPPYKEPSFNCPVCMGPLVEEMSTKCGHIFCKACIKAAIAAQHKCPTCRRKVTMKGTIRVYLPATS